VTQAVSSSPSKIIMRTAGSVMWFFGLSLRSGCADHIVNAVKSALG
jgi:hypothetical protein